MSGNTPGNLSRDGGNLFIGTYLIMNFFKIFTYLIEFLLSNLNLDGKKISL